MKRILLAVLFGVASLSSIPAKAQVSVNINIGSQPLWGPTGYDRADYYYLPDVDAYYNVSAAQYIYLVAGRWVWRNNLPANDNGFDLYNAYKVVLNTPRPYLSHAAHVKQYSRYKNYRGKQTPIRDSKDSRYTAARDNRSGNPGNAGNRDRMNDGHGNSGNRPGNNPNNNQGAGRDRNNRTNQNGSNAHREDGRRGNNTH